MKETKLLIAFVFAFLLILLVQIKTAQNQERIQTQAEQFDRELTAERLKVKQMQKRLHEL